MKVEQVHEQDKPEDALRSLIYTGSTRGVYTAYLLTSPYPTVEIETASSINSLFLKKALETILAQAVEPHDRFSFRFHINLIASETTNLLDLYNDSVTGLFLLAILLGIELKDTFIPYTKKYSSGSISICKGYFKNKIIFSHVFGSLPEEDIYDAISHTPEDIFTKLRHLLKKEQA